MSCVVYFSHTCYHSSLCAVTIQRMAALTVATFWRFLAVRLLAIAMLLLRSCSPPGGILWRHRIYTTRVHVYPSSRRHYGIRRRTRREFGACTLQVPRRYQARWAVAITPSVPCLRLVPLIRKACQMGNRSPYRR